MRIGTCKRPAGLGTDHPSAGGCWQHDKIPKRVQSLLPAPERFRHLSQKILDDKDPFQLREEIAEVRAAIQVILEDPRTHDDFLSAIPAINMLYNTLGKLVQKLHDIEVGRRYVVHVDVVNRSLQQITEIVIQYIPDPRQRAEAAQAISALGVQETDMPKTAPVPQLTEGERQLVSVLDTSGQ